jgi:UPF0148 protein
MSNDNIKKMADMLRNGATMLDKYCPKCENILFRLKNKIVFCPVCNLEVKIIKSDMNGKEQQSDHIPTPINTSFEELNNIYSNLFHKLSLQITNINEIFLMEKYINVLSKIMEIIKNIRDLQ